MYVAEPLPLKLPNRTAWLVALSAALVFALVATLIDPRVALGLAAALPVAILTLSVAMVPPQWGLLCVVALLPLDAFGLLEIGFGVRPAYMGLMALLAGILLRGYPLAKWFLVHRWLTVFLGISLLSVVFAPDVSATSWASNVSVRAGGMRSPIQLALLVFHFTVFVVTAYYAAQEQWRTRMLKLYLVVGAVLSSYGIYQTIAVHLGLPLTDITWAVDFAGSSTVSYGETRYYEAGVVDFAPRATFRESLHFAHYLLSFVPLAWAVSLSSESRKLVGLKRRTLLVIATLGSLALFLTFSRSGWGAFCVAAALLAVGLRGVRGFVLVSVSAGVMMVGVALLSSLGLLGTSMGFPDLVSGRLSTDTMLVDPRILYFAIFAKSFLVHPWLGLGVGNFALAGGAAYGSDTLHSAHGIFWSAGADSGVFAMFALFGFFALICWKLWRLRSTKASTGQPYLFVGIAASLVGMLSQNLFWGDRPELHLLFLTGIGAGLIGAYAGKDTPAAEG